VKRLLSNLTGVKMNLISSNSFQKQTFDKMAWSIWLVETS